jgi:3-oxoacyl-[acyl-carrier protein] reductase
MKNIVIVGASKGIGLATAQQLHTAGYTIINLSRTASADLQQLGVQQYTYNAVEDNASSITLPDAIDALIYCPGSINLKPFNRLSKEDFLADYNQNVLGAISIIQHCLPALKKAQGSIVLFSTVAVTMGMPFHASIAAAKGAVEALTRSLASELVANKVRVNCIAPSLTNTPLAAGLLNTPEKVEVADKRHPLQRIGQPQDIASLVSYLVSDNATWITGQVFNVDGGMSRLK